MNTTSKTGSLITLLKKSYIPFLQCKKKHSTLIGVKTTAKTAGQISNSFYYSNPGCFSEVFF